MRYLRDHWQGKHALLFALCVNLILIRALILFADRYTLPPYIPDRIPALIATVAFILLFHGVVFVWQMVGVLRATRHQVSILANIWTVVAYGVVGLSLVFTALSIAASFRALAPERFIPVNLTELEDARASQYALTLSSDATRIHVTGIFALGMAQRLAALLDENPAVTGIVLNSDGGHVYEGRGVGFLIRDRGLDTYVFADCSSACTTAFIGGAKRYLGPDGRLGFHQYKIDLNYPVPLYDIKGQQEKEITFYRSQGIAESFLEQVFLAPHTGIWFPEAAELIEAGVVDGVVEDEEIDSEN